MPAAIDPEVMNVDELPGVWSPVQWDMAPEERGDEVEEQASPACSIMWMCLRRSCACCCTKRRWKGPSSHRMVIALKSKATGKTT